MRVEMGWRLGQAWHTNVVPEFIPIVEVKFFSRANISCRIYSAPFVIGGRACVCLVAGSKKHVDIMVSASAVIDESSFEVVILLCV